MTSQPARDRVHARRRLDDAWRAVDQLPIDLRRVQVSFTNLSEEPTPEERTALVAAVNRVLGHFAEGTDALLAVRDWISPAEDNRAEGGER